MGLLSGITGIFTAGEKKKRNDDINAARRNQAAIRNFQQERAELADFRSAQANAVLRGFLGGLEGGSSASSADISSIQSQGRTLNLERRALEGFDRRIGYAQERLGRINQIRDLAAGADAVLTFGQQGGFTNDVKTNIFGI